MSVYTSARVGFDVERTAVPGGSFAAIGGPILHTPVIIIFDNQTNAAVEVSVDGVNTWKTFPAYEALLLDLRANSGSAPIYTIDLGTQFYITGSGSGQFSISLTYAR